jgi:GDP-4-dehydro-6-deoxy-D-mannose reductase
MVRIIREQAPEAKIILTDQFNCNDDINVDSNDILLADARKINELSSLVKEVKPDAIIHLSGLNYGDDRELFQVNLLGMLEILNASITLNPKPIVLLVGSAAQYGAMLDSKENILETDLMKPINIYGISKLFQEELGLLFCKTKELDVRFTRTFNIIGPRMNQQTIIGKVIAELRKNKKSNHIDTITVGSLSSYRDFIDVRDVVKLYSAILFYGQKGEIYNVGSGIIRQIRKVINELIAMSGQSIKIIETSYSSREFESKGGCADNHKVLQLLPTYSPISFAESIKDIIATI